MTPVKNGAQIQIGAELKIQAKNILSDKTLEEWKINGKTVSLATETFSRVIVKEDSDSNGKTHITYTLKKKVVLLKVHFDTAKVTVESRTIEAWKSLSPGAEITENTQLRLTAIGLSADTPVQSWKVGNTTVPASGHQLTYTVYKADADGTNSITITYIIKKNTLTVTFDSTAVRIFADGGDILTDGAEVRDGDRLYIATQNLSTGQTVDTWQIGKRTFKDEEHGGSNQCWFRVGSDYTEGNAINISYTTKNK